MAEKKNVGRMEQLLITGIGAIITTYLAAGTILNIEMPAVIGWVLALLVMAYFLNRVWLKVEDAIDNWILIQRMRAEQEKQSVRYDTTISDAIDKSLTQIENYVRGLIDGSGEEEEEETET